MIQTSSLRASFAAAWCLLSQERGQTIEREGAALVWDLLAQNAEEQAHQQIEDIDKETKFIWNH